MTAGIQAIKKRIAKNAKQIATLETTKISAIASDEPENACRTVKATAAEIVTRTNISRNDNLGSTRLISFSETEGVDASGFAGGADLAEMVGEALSGTADSRAWG